MSVISQSCQCRKAQTTTITLTNDKWLLIKSLLWDVPDPNSIYSETYDEITIVVNARYSHKETLTQPNPTQP